MVAHACDLCNAIVPVYHSCAIIAADMAQEYVTYNMIAHSHQISSVFSDPGDVVLQEDGLYLWAQSFIHLLLMQLQTLCTRVALTLVPHPTAGVLQHT